LRSFIALFVLATLAAYGQDRHDWQSLAQLHPGDRVRLSTKTGPVVGEFQTWTPQNLTVGSVTTSKEDVFKIQRYVHGGGRGKHAAIGALIGFGGGFGVGAAVGRCNSKTQWCIIPSSYIYFGGAVAGAVIGAVVGAFLPTHDRQTVYSVK
jgi:hypothetical protein